MYCEKCQKKYSSDEKFCSECGSSLVDELDIYAKQLLNKDESAFDKIYNDTKVWVMKKVSIQLFNEQDRLDCTQEIYLKLFKKIELYNPEKGKFRPWFNTLVSNQITDFIRKSMNEPEYESDEEILNQLADPTLIPEIAMEQNECTRLLHSIIESLPQEQKICVERFYMEGKRRKEVADILGLSEETIKSRLRLARNKIESKILELEKAGTKIYGLSPFAFFLLLNAKEKAEKADYALLYSNIMKKVNLTVFSTAGQAAATAGKAMIHKVAIALIATAVIGGSGVAVYTHQKENTKNAVVESNKEVEEKEYSEKELQTLLDDIDLDYLEPAMLVAPQFSDKNAIDENVLYSIPYISAIRKFSNTISGEDYYKMGNVINDKDVIKIEHSDDYQTGYILLEKNSFDEIFSILQQKFDISKVIEGEYVFNDNGQIKIKIDTDNELYESVRAANIETTIDSENQKIIIEYDFEVSYYDSGEKYIDDTYVVVLSPAENKFGYVMESKESKSEYLKRTEEEKRMTISDEELEKLADSLDMNLLTVMLSNYEDPEYDANAAMENMLINFATALYSNVDANEKTYTEVNKKWVDSMDSAEYFDEHNISFNRSKLEDIVYLLTNQNVDIGLLYQNNRNYILGDDTVTLIMDGIPDYTSPLIKDIKKIVNTKEKQIELEYVQPFQTETKTYDWKTKAIIVPASQGLGYAIKSVESIGILSETEAKAIAKDFGVPENLEVTYEQGFPTYWDAGGGYDFQFNVYHDNEIIAGGTLELESKEMWRNIMMYSGE